MNGVYWLSWEQFPENNPPVGVKLQVSDEDLQEIWDKQILEADSDFDCLYAEIVGNKQEKFLVTLTSADGKAENSVLFGFSS